MSSAKTRLERVDQAEPEDMVIGSRGPMPLFEGQDPESLICPGCGHDVTRGVSTLTMMSLFLPPGRLVFHCDCDAYSVVGDSID